MGVVTYRSCLSSLLIWQLSLCLFDKTAQGSPTRTDGDTAFDYVIVGGGNAGLTIASRLSEERSVRVAVIEAGNFYETTSGNFSSIPGDDVYYNGKDPKDTNPLLDWGFTTTPQVVSRSGKISISVVLMPYCRV